MVGAGRRPAWEHRSADPGRHGRRGSESEPAHPRPAPDDGKPGGAEAGQHHGGGRPRAEHGGAASAGHGRNPEGAHGAARPEPGRERGSEGLGGGGSGSRAHRGRRDQVAPRPGDPRQAGRHARPLGRGDLIEGSLNPPACIIESARVVEPRLRAFLDEKLTAFAALPVDLGDAAAALRDYLLRGGKRLRAALLLLGHEAGGGPREAALDASIGVELLHAYLLIHDDFMDQDDVRRGGPTLHRALGGDHLGASVALLCGSLCETWGYQLLGRAAPVAARTLEQVILGQMADVRAPSGRELTAREILEIQRAKTGSYTFELPLHLGATLAGASRALLEVLSAYARPLGVAFQIADDLLGTFGEAEVTGKSTASDLREGKRTLVVARALETASPEDAARLRSQLGRSDADVGELRAILRRSGAEASARAEADRHCDEALRALDSPALDPRVAQDLREIAVYTVRRSA